MKFKVNLGRDKRESRRTFPGIRDNELNSSTIPPKTGRVVTLNLTVPILIYNRLSGPWGQWQCGHEKVKKNLQCWVRSRAAEGCRFSSHFCVETDCEAHSASCTMSTEAFPGKRRPSIRLDRLPFLSTGTANMLDHVPTSPKGVHGP